MRDTTKLHPVLQTKLAAFKTACANAGYKIGIGECVRTVAEQDALYAQGRTKPGSIVTNAKGSSYSSMHQWGVAFDFYRNDGKGAYYNNDKFFDKVGAIGKKCGLEWGGDWKSPVDKPHFQLPDWGSTTTKLKNLYGTPDKFMKTWTTPKTQNTTTSYVYGGIDYSPVFNPTYYGNKYTDLKAAFGADAKKLFNHFCTNGMKEGRQAIATFNVQVYKNNYVDLQKAFGNNFPQYYKHYITNGKAEGRKCI